MTGASRGIGLAIARELVKEGARVAIVARGKKALTEAFKDLETLGGNGGHAAFALDLAADDGPKNLVRALKTFGVPEIAVHNLGGTLDIRDPLCSISQWRKVMRLNLEVAVELNRLLIPAMRKRGWGRLIHVSSVSGGENLGPIPYCTSKAALNAYTRSLGRVLAPDGIVVTALSPGAVFAEDGPWDRASKQRPEHVRRYLRKELPTHRFAGVDEISALAVFLCSERASQCNGGVFSVDGGLGRGFVS